MTTAVDPQTPITTPDQLHTHLIEAAAVELSTIPLYLYALYSIKASGDYQWDAGISAQRTIRSVVIEEMLHLCLVRNVLLATGGDMTLYDKAIVPEYPSLLRQHSPDLMLHLEPCTPELMRRVFMPLERPEGTDAPPEPDRYQTLGQFYAAIVAGLELLSGPDLWKDSRGEYQYHNTYWNQDGGGEPVPVTDLPTALQALRIIVEQGEGASSGDRMSALEPQAPVLGYEEWSHYAKFHRIAEGIDPVVAGAIDQSQGLWPVPTDPKAADFEGPVRDLAVLFNAAYCYVLKLIDALYSEPRHLVAGQHDKRYGIERTFIASMGGLLYPLADLLVQQPGPDGHNAAPTFEFHEFEQSSARQELVDRCTALLPTYPGLGGDDGVLWLIEKLPDV
jgi:hypothetical protein